MIDDKEGFMTEEAFLFTRKIFHKYHEMATRTILNWHISERRKHIKALDKLQASV